MPFLELTLRCTEATQPRYENALEDVGALAVTLLDADGEPDSIDASLWGIESECSDYHEEVIGELITECLHQITATIGE